jgi:hypothetical protein
MSSELTAVGVTGKDKSEWLKETEDTPKKHKDPIDFLKDGITMSEIVMLAKNKRLTRNTIKKEIAKKLNDENELKEFLNSVVDYFNKTKGETKEATGTGGFSGSFETLFSGEEPKKVEAKEATGSASSGPYVTTAAWAKSTNKKDWRGKSKTQIPGGKFVQVKKKCKKFPYCNQGDINALKIFENETLQKVINRVSENYQIHQDIIKDIILNEYKKIKNS